MRKKLLLVLGGIVFGLLCGEIVARVVLPLLPDPRGTPFVSDGACMYRLRPSEPDRFPEYHDHHINTFGFRDRNHPGAKPTGRRRVLGLGDSFVYGAVPIGDNFLRVAEQELNRMLDTPADILLMGVPGWSTENQLGYLRSEGLALDPDLVLIHFYVGNDVTGIPVRGRVIRGNVYPTTSPLPVRNLLRKSHLFVMFESLLLRKVMKEIKKMDPTTGDAGEATEDVSVSEIYLNIVRHSLPVFRRPPDPRTEALWEEAESYLAGIDRACGDAGVPWLLVLVPDEMQVDDRVRAEVLTGLDAEANDFDFEAPQKRLSKWADAHGVRVLDLLPEMRREHRPQARLYVPNDTHWNRRGNQVAGMLVGRTIGNLLSAAP
jgi:hypothetical protein